MSRNRSVADGIANTSEIADGAITSSKLANNSVTNSHLTSGLDPVLNTINGGPIAGFRNKIINGDMRIAQRGTSAALTTSFTYGSVDRWAFSQGTSANGLQMRNGAVTNGITKQFQYAMQVGRNTTATTTGNVEARYMMEDKDVFPLRGQTCTISFYYRRGTTLIDPPYFYLVTGTAANESVTNPTLTGQVIQINNPAISSWSTTWKRAEATFVMPDDALGCRIQFGFVPTGTADVDDFIYITGVQLEVGPLATQFEHRPYGLELSLCQRYFEKTYEDGVAPGTVTTTGVVAFRSASTSVEADYRFKVPKRSLVGVTIYSPNTGTTGVMRDASSGSDVTVQVSYGGQNGVFIQKVTGGSVGNSYNFHATFNGEIV